MVRAPSLEDILSGVLYSTCPPRHARADLGFGPATCLPTSNTLHSYWTAPSREFYMERRSFWSNPNKDMECDQWKYICIDIRCCLFGWGQTTSWPFYREKKRSNKEQNKVMLEFKNATVGGFHTKYRYEIDSWRQRTINICPVSLNSWAIDVVLNDYKHVPKIAVM